MDFRKVTSEHIRLYRNEVLRSASASTFDRKMFSLKKFFDWAVKEGYIDENPAEEFLKAEAETVETKLGKIEKEQKAVTPSYNTLQARIVAKFAGNPKLQKLAYNVFYTRPKWYKSYHNLPIATYFNYAILILLMSGLGFGVYNQFFKTTSSPQAFPAALTRAGRYLSFQGRLTTNLGNPITSATNVNFKLYNASSSGTLLWDSSTCSITPDTDGIFSTLLGNTCGTEIASSVFTENSAVWLGVTVGADTEATPRVQIATVAYALNSETLQGFPASMSATANTIPAINSSGYLVLGTSSPKIQSTSGNFAIEGQTMTINTPTGSNGSITIAPDGTGSANFNFSGATPGNGKGMMYITDANLNSKALIYGSVANDSTGYNLLELASGTTPRTKFAVDSAGNATMSGTVNGLAISGGAITSGSWTGSLIDSQYGGTGANNSSAAQYSIPYYSATGVMGGVLAPSTSGYLLSTNSTGSAPSWISASGVGTNYWQLANNILAPINVTNDLAIGGNSTASAKFQVFGVNGNIKSSGIATISGSLALGNTTAAVGPGHLNMSGNLVVGGTTGFGGLTYTWPGSHTAGFLVDNAGTLSWTTSLPSGTTLGFDKITTGTNNTAQTLTVGNTSSLTYSGSGTINASSLIGGTWAAPGAIGSTTPNTGAFTTLSSNTLSTGYATMSGSLALGNTSAAIGPGHLNMSGNLTAGGTINGLTVSSGTISSGTWNGTTIGTQYGGTGKDWHLTAAGSIVYFDSAGSMSTLSPSTNDYVLTTQGSGTPQWKNVTTLVPAATNYWQLANHVVAPGNAADYDLAIGGSSTASAKFQVLASNGNLISSGNASISGSLTFRSGAGSIGTTTMSDLTLGSSTTGNVILNSRGSTALTANGANLTAGGTFTLPNSNTMTGVANYLRLSQGLSVGGSDTYHIDSTGDATLKNIGFVYATGSGSLALGNTTAAIGPGHLNLSGNITAGGTINGLTVSSGTISSGTWNGTAIGATYGGTGQTVYAVGDLLYANTTTTLSRLADIATGNVLISGGTNTAPSWGKVVLGTHTTGNYVSSIIQTANQISASSTTGDVTLSIPSDFRAPGTVNAVNGLYTGATAGTQRIDATGNLVNIANISASGYATISASLALGNTTALAGPGNLNASGRITGVQIYQGANQVCDTSGNCGGSGVNHWQLANNILAPINVTNDLTIGGNSTASAKFQVFGTTGDATMSGNLTLGFGHALQSQYGPLTLNYKSAANTWTPGLTLTDITGRVGIGTASPTEKLQVAGNIIALNDAARVYFTAQSGNTIGPEFRIASTDTGGHEYRIGSSASGNSIGAGSFYFYDQTYSAMRFVIDPNGLFGIGRNAPTAKLDVADSSLAASTSNILSATSSAMQTGNLLKIGEGGTQTFSGNAIFADIANGGGGAFTGNFVKFNNAGTTKFTVDYTGKVTGTAIYQGANQVCDTSGNCGGSGVNHWLLSNNILSPINPTNDLAIGGSATSSAKFQVFGTTGNASMSGTLTVANGQAIQSAYGPLTLNYKSGANTWAAGLSLIPVSGNVVVANDLQVTGNDILDSAATSRVTLGATTTLTNTTTTLSGTTTMTASSLATMTTAANLAMSSTTGLTLGGNSTINGGTGSAGTLRIDSTSNATKGNLSFNGTTTYIDGLGNLKVGGYATASGSLALGSSNAAAGPGNLNMSGNLTVGGTTTLGGYTYTWPTTGQTSGYVLSTNGTGTLSWLSTASFGTNHWQLANNILAPINVTNDLTIGGNSTASAKFQVFGATGNATMSGNLTIGYGKAIQSAYGPLTLNYKSGANTWNAGITLADVTGNVGIGTTTPNNLIQVAGLINFDNTDFNTKVGYQAGNNFVSGAQFNTFFGYQAGLASASGSTNAADYNTGIGYSALYSNTSGYYNVALGSSSMHENTSGYYNTAVGVSALYNNTSGYYNTAVGKDALASNTTGDSNVAVGLNTLANNTTGWSNIAIGDNVMDYGAAGYWNIAMGQYALRWNTLGHDNTALGRNVMKFNYTGFSNNGIGSDALASLQATNHTITALANSTVNPGTKTTVTSASHGLSNGAAVAVFKYLDTTVYDGYWTISNVTTNTFDIPVVYSTPYAATMYWTLQSEAYGNVALGDGAGYTVSSGSLNTFIGYDADTTLASVVNSIALGNGAHVTASNQVVLGNDSITQTLLKGNVGIGTTSPLSRLSVVGTSANSIGKAAFLVDQYENQDILTASASGVTKMTLKNDGTLSLYNATSSISNTSGDITLNAASNNIAFSGDSLINIGNITAAGVINVGGKNGVAYNTLAGAGDSPVSSAITTSNDLFVGGDLELKGGLYLTGKNIYNGAAGTIIFATDPTAINSYNTLTNGSWLVNNSTNNGLASLMVNQNLGGDILTASASGATKMVLTNGGYLGLGTTTPAEKLHIDTGAGNNGGLRIDNNNGVGAAYTVYTDYGALLWFTGVDGSDAKYKIRSSGSTWAAGTDRITIATDGRVGIGTSNPGAALDVAGGTIYTSSTGNNSIELGQGQTNNQYAYMDFHTDATYTDYGLRIIRDASGANSNATITNRGTGSLYMYQESNGVYLATGATAWTANSDLRLKNVTGGFTNALSDINQLNPIHFTWKSDSTNVPQVGLIAQDVQKVLPEIVHTDDNGYLGVEYTGLIPLLTAGVKELNTKVDSLAGVNMAVATDSGDLLIAQTPDGTYQVTNNTNNSVITQIVGFAQVVAGSIKAGAVVTKELAAESFTSFQGTVDNMLVKSGLVAGNIKTKMISPLAGEDLAVELPQDSKFKIQDSNKNEVASIDSSGNATFSGTLFADNINSKSLDEIKNLLTKVQTDQSLLASASAWSITATSSANLDSIATADLYVTNQAAINSLSVTNSLTIGTDMVFDSTNNSIETLTSPLKIQSLAMAPIEMMAGLIKIDTSGNVQIAGNLAVAGRVDSSGLTLKDNDLGGQSSQATDSASLLTLQNASGTNVATVDASGSAIFNNISTQGLTIAGAIEATNSAVVNGIIRTNATAGAGTVPAGVSEITIENANVTDYTLVYVTPTSSTDNYVLYVKSKGPGRFVVGFTNPISIDVNFNWWIVKVAQ